MKQNIKDYNIEELKQKFVNLGEKSYRAEQVFKWLFVHNVKSFEEMTNISNELIEKLKEKYELCIYDIITKQESEDGTKKYLFDIGDGNAIETVLMEYKHGRSVCVSTQVGCKMGCTFCASTGAEFIRNLTAGEIVEQLLAVERVENIKISNVVYMGIGEPLDNYNSVLKSIRIINNPKALNIGARHISISTSGIVPKIYNLADEQVQCTLSISLHATNNSKRSELMPINNAYNIEELLKACKYYINKTNRRISFEYALAKDKNDNLEDAKELVKLLRGMICHVNLIPINKIENNNSDNCRGEGLLRPTNENVLKFRDYLISNGITATVRRELGADIEAACGQLRRKSFDKISELRRASCHEVTNSERNLVVSNFIKTRFTNRKAWLIKMVSYAESSIGKVRKENQDYYYISKADEEPQLFIIADGMGGCNGGEVASRLAVEAIKDYIKSNFISCEEDILELIRSGIEYANKKIYDSSIRDEQLEGMGTTVVVCIIHSKRVYIGHVGDSRLYRLRKNVLRQITKDHSYVEDLVMEGTITREDAYSHPDKHMLTKALGCNTSAGPDLVKKMFFKNDILILTTDGLTNMIKEDEIKEIIEENSDDLKNATKKLINVANENGGDDNTTVIVIQNV